MHLLTPGSYKLVNCISRYFLFNSVTLKIITLYIFIYMYIYLCVYIDKIHNPFVYMRDL